MPNTTQPRWGGRRTQRFSQQVRARYGHRCWLCGHTIDPNLKWPNPKSFTVDHVHPRSHEGARYDLDNARPAHLSCNSARGNRAPDTVTPNPTSQDW